MKAEDEELRGAEWGCILISGTWWPTWLTKDEARQRGYIYRDPEGNEYR